MHIFDYYRKSYSFRVLLAEANLKTVLIKETYLAFKSDRLDKWGRKPSFGTLAVSSDNPPDNPRGIQDRQKTLDISPASHVTPGPS